MTTRRKKAILKAILLEMQKDYSKSSIPIQVGNLPYSGICSYIDSYFRRPYPSFRWTCSEYYEFMDWFHRQRPTAKRNKEFFEKENKNSAWWWMSYSFAPREAFLKHLLKKRLR